MKINSQQIKFLDVAKYPQTANIGLQLSRQRIEQVDDFQYLGIGILVDAN